jgi:hypothetical protein
MPFRTDSAVLLEDDAMRRLVLDMLVIGSAAMGLCFVQPASSAGGADKISEPTLTVITGSPRERGRSYGQKFKSGIHSFLNAEIYKAFSDRPAKRDDMLRYANACAGEIKTFSPVIFEELEGMAEGAGLGLSELVLLTLHEELYHRGVLPPIEHCTAVAAGPPLTVDQTTLVGQTWDWMTSVAGKSSVMHWKRSEGPSVLAYGFPGLWVGAGMNSAGLALCWTSADLGNHQTGARVGVPAYVLLTHLLYQPTLADAVREAEKGRHAGWFTFVLADGKGSLVNIEGAPGRLSVERHRGRLARVGFGSRKMTGTPAQAEVKLHERCRHMYELLDGARGKLDRAGLQHFFAEPKCGICVGKSTIDMMVFNTSTREAFVSRGSSYGASWRRFTFED